MKSPFNITLASRTNMVALATVTLGVAKLLYPELDIDSSPEVLILGGLGLLYVREAVG